MERKSVFINLFEDRGFKILFGQKESKELLSSLWEYQMCPVYGFFILNFRMGLTDKVRMDILLADRETGKQMSNVFREIFIEMPLFKKTESECETLLDYRLRVRRHYLTVWRSWSRANMNKKEREEYEECLKVYRDNYSIALYQKQQMEARYQEGLQLGEERGGSPDGTERYFFGTN